MFQKAIVAGYVGQDPAMRYTAEGVPVTSFSVATSRSWTDNSGVRQQKTTWFRVTAWRKLAEVCNQYLTKGRPVLVEGELVEPKPWQNRDGEWRASLELRAATVTFLGRKDDTHDTHDTHDTQSEEIIEEVPF